MSTPRGHSARHERNLERNIGTADLFDTDSSAVVPGHAEDQDLAARIAREAAQREAARRANERVESEPPA